MISVEVQVLPLSKKDFAVCVEGSDEHKLGQSKGLHRGQPYDSGSLCTRSIGQLAWFAPGQHPKMWGRRMSSQGPMFALNLHKEERCWKHLSLGCWKQKCGWLWQPSVQPEACSDMMRLPRVADEPG